MVWGNGCKVVVSGPPPKDSRRVHSHAGLNKGHYSCLTQEEAKEAPGQPDKERATGSLKEAKGHICAVEDLAGVNVVTSSWDLGTAWLLVCQGNVLKFGLFGEEKMSIDSESTAE